MQEVNFEPLYEYLGERFGEIDGRFDSLERRVCNLESQMDRTNKILSDVRDEMVVVNHRLDKLEQHTHIR